MLGTGGDPVHLRAAEDAHARRARRHRMGRAPQRVVGDDGTQCLRAAGVQPQGAVATQGAIVHLGLAYRAAFMCLQAGPGAQALQGGHAGVGERDLAAIGCWVGQCRLGLLLHHRGAEAGLRQSNGERKPGGAAAHD